VNKGFWLSYLTLAMKVEHRNSAQALPCAILGMRTVQSDYFIHKICG